MFRRLIRRRFQLMQNTRYGVGHRVGHHKLAHTPNLIEDAPYNIYRHRTVDYTPTLDLGPSGQALP